MNGHVGAEVDSFEGVHGGYGFGRRNVDGEMLLEFADALDFAIVNTWFKKEVGKMITYETKACKTIIDFFLIRKRECNLLGMNCVADVVRRGRLRWFGHLERKGVDDWVSACRGLVVEGARGQGRSRKTWEQCQGTV